jgi:peptidoglycan hydrolase-like protein with peptidoglycan-binding domain
MRKLILTTASVLALSLAAGGAYAQGASQTAPPPAQTRSGLDQANPQANSAPANPEANVNGGAPSTMAQSPQQQNMQAPPNEPQNGMQNEAELQRPMSKSQVRQLQQRLRADGYYRGHIDGIMGPQTRRALQQAREQQSGAENGNAVGEGSSAPPASMQQNQPQGSEPGAAGSSHQGTFNEPGAGANNGAAAPYQQNTR